MILLTSEHTSSEDYFERKCQDKISPSDQSFENKEEELIDCKEEHHYALRKFPSVPIQKEVLNLTYEHPSTEDYSESKIQANISMYEKNHEKPEEELVPLTKSDCDKLHSDIKTMNEHITTMLAKMHDKSEKKTEKQLHPMSVQITELSSKQSEKIQN